MGPSSLSSSEWARFVAERWEQAPVVLEQPGCTPILSRPELFEAMLAAATAYRASGDDHRKPRNAGARVRFCVEHAAVFTDVDKLLPAPPDRSIEGWVARVEQQLGGRPFELILNEFQEHSDLLWRRLRGFLEPLYRRVGIPAQRAEAAVFLRKQPTTSFGVHKDDASVFLFVLEGRRDILAWPPEVFDGRAEPLSTTDYEKYRGDAVTLRGEPGDLLYWPSSHWHIGESGPALSISLNVGLHLHHRPSADVAEVISRLVSERLGADGRVDTHPFDPDRPQRCAERPPEILDRVVQAFCDPGRRDDLERAVRLSWLSRVSGAGFTRVPPPLPPGSLDDRDRIRGDRASTIVWVPWEDGTIACSANGHSFSVTLSPGVSRLLEQVRGGAWHRVGALLSECADDAEERQFLAALLAKLLSLRALERGPAALAGEIP